MIPVTTQTGESSGCVYKSAKCVVWEGPAIPCIDEICSGTSIQDIIFQLGTMVCDIQGSLDQNWTFDNINCLLDDDEAVPTGQHEIITAIINKLCDNENKNLSCSCEEPLVTLAKCHLHPGGDFEDWEGKHSITEAIERLSAIECETNSLFSSEIETNVQNINNLVETINNLSIEPTVYETPSVTTQCASGSGPGEVLPVTEAFENFETTYCNFIENIGTTDEIENAISKQCKSLCTESTCVDEKATYCELPEWVSEPKSLADSLNNLWIYICDQRECKKTQELPCVALPPSDIDVNYTESTLVVSFVENNYSEIQEPLNYNIKIYNSDSSGYASGEPLIDQTVISPDSISNASLSPSQDYVIKITAVYNCGISEAATYVGKVKTCAATNKIYIENTQSNVPITCLGTNYTEWTNSIVAKLQTGSGSVANNETSSDIVMTLRLEVEDPLLANTVYETYIMTIPPNNSQSAPLEYISETYIDAGGSSCEAFVRGNTKSRVDIIDISLCGVRYTQTDTNIKS